MKTVLTDNSLCVYPLKNGADPELICAYINALAKAGVDYVELDFRTLVRVKKLPENVKYIFRMVDPMFLSMTDFCDFSYLLVTYSDLREKIKTKIPVMLEIPYLKNTARGAVKYAESRVDGNITALRVRAAFEYDEPDVIKDVYKDICEAAAPLAVDVCPLNEYKTAVDTALKFTAAGAQSLTLAAGLPVKYGSLEEYLFTLACVFNSLPSKFDLHGLGVVSVLRNHIFQTGAPALPALLDTIDSDLRCLKNADTGEDVGLYITMKNSEYLNQTFVSALEKMAQDEKMPEDIYEDISKAIAHYDRGMYNEELLHKKRTGLLN